MKWKLIVVCPLFACICPLIEKRYEDSLAAPYRSDYQGALLLDFTHKYGIKINAWRQGQPRYWQDAYEQH
ncbi:MAG: hypothetical protein WBL28_09235 [Methylotenera sp.]